MRLTGVGRERLSVHRFCSLALVGLPLSFTTVAKISHSEVQFGHRISVPIPPPIPPFVAARAAGETLRLEAASLAIHGGLLDSAETLLLPLLGTYQAGNTGGGGAQSAVSLKALQVAARLHLAQVCGTDLSNNRDVGGGR